MHTALPTTLVTSLVNGGKEPDNLRRATYHSCLRGQNLYKVPLGPFTAMERFP